MFALLMTWPLVKRYPVRARSATARRIKQWQRLTRHVFDGFACEAVVISLVILYAIVIFVDLAYTAAREVEASSGEEGKTADRWDDAMKNFDLVLLSIFMVEIIMRLFGFRLEYLKDCINATDAVVVVSSWIIVVMPDSLVRGLSWFRLFRIVRLFRFAVIINKLQRSRDAAAMTRKRNMYKKIGAPVEKVLDFFEDLRSRMPEKKDQEYLSWMMEVIASDDLYRVRNFDTETMKKLGGEGDDMHNFISQATGISTAGSTSASGAGAVSSTAEAGPAPSLTKADSAAQLSSALMTRKLSKGGLAVPTFLHDGLWADAMLRDDQLVGMLHTLHGEDAWGFDNFAFDRLCKQKVRPDRRCTRRTPHAARAQLLCAPRHSRSRAHLTSPHPRSTATATAAKWASTAPAPHAPRPTPHAPRPTPHAPRLPHA